jgi:hypothetical protein
MELLSRLQTYIREKGFQPFRPMGPDDPIEDLRYEVFRAQREQNKKRNVKYMQRALITVAAGLEMLHKKWNPLDLKLEGYSKSILLTIHDFDEIFEELHWKYCDAVAMPVEIKLVLTLASSVWFYHLSAANNISSSSSTGRASGFASSEMPPPTTDEEPSQPRMSGPKMGGGGGGFASGSVSGGFASGVGSAPDMSGLLSGLGMVQTLLQI